MHFMRLFHTCKFTLMLLRPNLFQLKKKYGKNWTSLWVLIPWLQSFLPGKKPPQYTPLRNWGPLCHTGVRMGRRWMGKRWISTTSDTSTRNMERQKKILSNSFDIPCRHTYIKRSPFLPYCTPECIISLWASLANKGRAALWARAHCRTGVKAQHRHGALKYWSRLEKKPPTKSSPKHRSFDQPGVLQRFYTCQTNLELTVMKTQRHPQCSLHFPGWAWKVGVSKEDTMVLQIPVW